MVSMDGVLVLCVYVCMYVCMYVCSHVSNIQYTIVASIC